MESASRPKNHKRRARLEDEPSSPAAESLFDEPDEARPKRRGRVAPGYDTPSKDVLARLADEVETVHLKNPFSRSD